MPEIMPWGIRELAIISRLGEQQDAWTELTSILSRHGTLTYSNGHNTMTCSNGPGKIAEAFYGDRIVVECYGNGIERDITRELQGYRVLRQR